MSVVSPRDQDNVRKLCDSVDELWDLITVQDWPSGPGDYPVPSDARPLGLVTSASVRHTFDHYVCFVLDTDQGQVFTGHLDERGIGRTPSEVTVGTADREVSVTLAVADQAPSTEGTQLIWQGVLECPTGEIGIMDSTGLILMYVQAPDPAPVQIWGNAVPEPDEIVVIVG